MGKSSHDRFGKEEEYIEEEEEEEEEEENQRLRGRVLSLRDMGVCLVHRERPRTRRRSVDAHGLVQRAVCGEEAGGDERSAVGSGKEKKKRYYAKAWRTVFSLGMERAAFNDTRHRQFGGLFGSRFGGGLFDNKQLAMKTRFSKPLFFAQFFSLSLYSSCR